MAVEWVEVADSAVKIGLGALITIAGGWITLKLTHRHEIRKEAAAQRLKDKEKKQNGMWNFLPCLNLSCKHIYMCSVKQVMMIILHTCAYIMR
ncbi:hypothetical protein [Enterobacter sp. JJBC]|uniref:hypothetical protein n=1 Tax=Enterobacter sp. JJBC TaxID=3080020 RepID=UPI0030D38758